LLSEYALLRQQDWLCPPVLSRRREALQTSSSSALLQTPIAEKLADTLEARADPDIFLQ
jgi:hypothetical protein